MKERIHPRRKIYIEAILVHMTHRLVASECAVRAGTIDLHWRLVMIISLIAITLYVVLIETNKARLGVHIQNKRIQLTEQSFSVVCDDGDVSGRVVSNLDHRPPVSSWVE